MIQIKFWLPLFQFREDKGRTDDVVLRNFHKLHIVDGYVMDDLVTLIAVTGLTLFHIKRKRAEYHSALFRFYEVAISLLSGLDNLLELVEGNFFFGNRNRFF